MKYNIAVTATGGGVGQSILKALKGSNYNVIALDGEPLGAGLYMVKDRFVIPYANEFEFLGALVHICIQKKVDLLFPGMDVELPKFAEFQSAFKKVGTRVVISEPWVVSLADDKLATAMFLKVNGLPYPKTHSLASIVTGDEKLDYPMVLKPKNGGARSKGVFHVKSEREMEQVIHNINPVNYVAQEYIEGDEYTCGTVTLTETFQGCVIMRRILRDGDTYKAFVTHHEVIEDLCRKVCEIIKPVGAFNIQLRLRDGVPYVFEFNARCSGTTAARALAGFNEPLMIADYFLKGERPRFDIKDVTILRYWNELVLDNEDIIDR